MSYCRWSECDVYAYDSCEGGVQFYVAGSDSLNRLCGTYSEAYQYAKELRDKHGLDVPSHAIDALREDAIDEAKRHSAELVAAMEDNTKLRQLAADLLKGFECGWPSDVCGDCERDAEGMPTHGCPLRNRARELGVPEV